MVFSCKISLKPIHWMMISLLSNRYPMFIPWSHCGSHDSPGWARACRARAPDAAGTGAGPTTRRAGAAAAWWQIPDSAGYDHISCIYIYNYYITILINIDLLIMFYPHLGCWSQLTWIFWNERPQQCTKALLQATVNPGDFFLNKPTISLVG